MATITGFTAARMLAIEDNSIVDGDVVGDNLILTRHSGATINAGSVRGPTGSPGITSGELAAGLAGAATVTQMNTEITNRTNGDNTLTTNLNAEITNRTNGDNAEIAARSKYSSGLVTHVTNATTGLSVVPDGNLQDVPGVTASFTSVAGRRYRLHVSVSAQANGASASSGTIAITDLSGNIIHAVPFAVSTSGARVSGIVEYPWTAPSNAVAQFKARIYCPGTSCGFIVPLGVTVGSIPWGTFAVYDAGAP